MVCQQQSGIKNWCRLLRNSICSLWFIMFPRASNPYTGAQDGEMFAFFGGNKNNNKTPENPTKKTRIGVTDAIAASTGMSS